MAKIDDDEMFKRTEGPLAVIRTCRLCAFYTANKKIYPGQRSPIGRGHGFVVGNKARGEMIQHFKAAHPIAYEAAKQKGTS